MAKFFSLYCAFTIFLFIQASIGLQLGSRGANSLHIRQENDELDAGKFTKNENHNRNIKIENNILRRFANKEFLFADEGLDVAKNIDNSKTVKTAILDPSIKKSLEQKSSKASIDSKLLRQQRTHSDQVPEELQNMMFTFLKLNKMNKKPQVPSAYEYLFDEPYDSEDNMKLNEIKGSIGNSKDESYEENESNFEDLYEQLMSKANELSSREPFKQHIIKPSLHYKEAYISGDIYPHMKEVQQNDDEYKNIKAHPSAFSPDPNHAKYNKYNINDPVKYQAELIKNRKDYLFVSVIIGCSIAALLAIIAGGVCFFTINRSKNSGFESKHGIFGTMNTAGKSGSIKSTTSSSSGDRRLAQSAQMFHYQHQKQQMIAMEKANNDTKQDQSDNSEGEAEEGDYTVYECPGLAPTGEMEVKNPLFKEDFSNGNLMASSNSISSMPPAYASVITSSEAKPTNSSVALTEKNLIDINENPKDSTQISTLTENQKQ